ncbi:MAG: DUF4249 domain-containing protein, partial [Muribaculaceae bacterium]|nr:DUF4249 domain-containing protein [Muribaculaceae bacterium]
MKILNHILALSTAALLTGCFENFEPDTDTSPVLCINSLITAGQTIDVNVSRTWLFSDEESALDHSVTDATVTVYANGQPVGSNYIPNEGDLIRIVAESSTYGTATAEVVVPHAATIGRVEIKPQVTDRYTGNSEMPGYETAVGIAFNLATDIEIIDRPGIDNYFCIGYNWSSQAVDSDDTADEPMPPYLSGPMFTIGSCDYASEPIFSEHIGVFETAMGNGDDSSFAFFSDSQFRDKTYTLHLNFKNNSFDVPSHDCDEALFDCSINLYLSTVSKSYYNWAIYQWNSSEGILGELTDIGLADPIWGYSNVSTGAGVVAAQSISKHTISLKQFLTQEICHPGADTTPLTE